MTPALALLAVALTETYQVPPGKWLAVPLPPVTALSRVRCEYTLLSGGAGVRAVLVPQKDAPNFEKGHHVYGTTGFEQRGRVVYEATPGRYALVLDNRLEGRYWAEVFVRVSIAPPPEPPLPRYVSPRRRAVIIALSFVFLAGVCSYAGRKLRHAMARRTGPPPPA